MMEDSEKHVVKYRQLGDGSWAARITHKGEIRAVHINKSRSALEKVVKDKFESRGLIHGGNYEIGDK